MFVKGMGACTGGAATKEACCGCLRTLALEPEACSAAIRAGAIAVVAGVLAAHPSHAGVVEHGCGALANLSAAQGVWAPAGLGTPRVAEAVAAAMRAQRGGPASAAVQALGSGALRNLTASRDVVRAARSAGALEAAIEALRLHSDRSDVAESAAGAIWGLCTLPINAEEAAAAGAAGLLVASLVTHHTGSVNAAELASGALRCLAAASPTGRAAVLDAGGLDAARAVAASPALTLPGTRGAAAQAAGLASDLEAAPPEFPSTEEPQESAYEFDDASLAAAAAAASAAAAAAAQFASDYYPSEETIAAAAQAAQAARKGISRQCGLFF